MARDSESKFDWMIEQLLPLFFAYGAGEKMGVVHESFAHYSLGMDIYRFD